MKSDNDIVDDFIELYNQLLRKRVIKEYIFAGHSTFTIESTKIGQRYTYKVKRQTTKSSGKVSYQVYRLYGPDNTDDYRFICLVADDRKTILVNQGNQKEMSIVMFKQFIDMLYNDEAWPEKCRFYKSNRCAKCGRLLTTPDSVEIGYGPTCREAIQSHVSVVSTRFKKEELESYDNRVR